MPDKISIIIPSYNDAEELENLLCSIIKQSYKNYEVLLIDGGSEDETNSLASKYSDIITYYISEPDKGIYDAMNKGISKANGDWLYFIGCDDVFFDNDVLATIFDSNNYSQVDVLYGNIYDQKKKQKLGEPISKKVELMTKSLWHQSIFYRKKVFRDAGLYNINYKISADVVFNLNLLTQYKCNWVYTNTTVASFSGEGISSEISDKKFHADLKRLYKKWFYDASKSELYNGLQHHVYNEVKIGSTLTAVKELILVFWHTKKIMPYLKHFLYYTKVKYFDGNNSKSTKIK